MSELLVTLDLKHAHTTHTQIKSNSQKKIKSLLGTNLK